MHRLIGRLRGGGVSIRLALSAISAASPQDSITVAARTILYTSFASGRNALRRQAGAIRRSRNVTTDLGQFLILP